jgi:hypothetical protein
MKLVPALFAAAALLGASAALAAPPAGSPSAQSPAQRCAAERTQMGTPAFKQLYGTNANKANAFGKCVAKVAAAQSQNEQGAAQTCKTEQADTNFAANHGGKSFDQFYGSGPNGKNAFGKCVSGKAQSASDTEEQSTVNAAKTCRAEQTQDAAAFKSKYGTNANKSNAFGKCVSAHAKA